MFEIMIDTGGTFTDGVLADDKQTLSVAKAETVPADPAKSILNCITHLAEERSTTLEELLRHTGYGHHRDHPPHKLHSRGERGALLPHPHNGLQGRLRAGAHYPEDGHL